MNELLSLAKEMSSRVRTYRAERALLSRLIAAMRCCCLVALRFTRQLAYVENQLQWVIHEDNELQAAIADCGNDEALAREIVIARRKKFIGQGALYDKSDAARSAVNMRTLRHARSRLLREMPPLEVLPEIELELGEAVVIVQNEIKIRASQIGDVLFAVCECSDQSCEARLMTVAHFPYPVVQRAASLPCCKACRKLINECDTLKDDIAALSGGQITMQRVDFPTKPGRPKK
jgi:hypothetical protein